ncbi:phage tail protein [Vibrio parahaemolyticus]|uniref:phage tail protein n=1 Tax=Vibrio parahaemolyticus TaxID=670 RepID=UPI000A3A7555|nr:phage tail protein [Vibrio parahaemolyticus]MDF4625052.1 phage tail protein [Vibrio parahaemolyticus]OUJ42311.1 phage tail protein [Vibrio parahaemolyticus]TOG92695.1 phage tail protein [Vibrio parahaemolyticus]TOJ83031.1 phage tail protein [Vibrio parahaemolyticus]
MPEITNFEHNGITVESNRAPSPMGALGGCVFGVVGMAPNADPDYPRGVPIRIANLRDAARLDMNSEESGTLWRFCNFVLSSVSVPIYVVIEEEGVDADGNPDEAATLENIAGVVDPATGQRSGLYALTECQETPTHIFAPGYSNIKAISDRMVEVALRLYAIPVLDGTNTNDNDAIAQSAEMGPEGTGYEAAYLVDPWATVFSFAAGTDVLVPSSTIAAVPFARVDPWVSPASDGGVNISGVSRQIDYNIMDKSTGADLLMKNGVSILCRTSLGGYSLKGNRTVTGDFVNKKGLEYAIIRKLASTSEVDMAKPLTKTFMQQKCESLNAYLQTLKADDTIMGAEVYLHPTLNDTDKYMNGTWAIAIKYAGYSPNEHMVYVLTEDTEIVTSFLEDIL